MPRVAQIVIIILLASSLGLAGCNNATTTGHATTSSVSENQSSPIADNVTNQTQNIPPPVQIIDVDKRTGKELSTESSVITLTPEQQAEIQKAIEEKRKLIDTSQIRFQSGYLINVTAGTIDTSIQDDEKASANEYYVIQFYTDMASGSQYTRYSLEQSGCVFYSYVPNYAYYVKIPSKALDTVISLVNNGKVRYLGRIPTEAKISPELLAKAQENPSSQFDLVIHLFDKANPVQVNSLKDIMQVRSYHYDISNFVDGNAPGSSIHNIIAMSFVKWVAEQSTVHGCNDDSTSETETQQPGSK